MKENEMPLRQEYLTGMMRQLEIRKARLLSENKEIETEMDLVKREWMEIEEVKNAQKDKQSQDGKAQRD